MEKYFSVRITAPKTMIGMCQPGTELAMIVYFTIEYEDDFTVSTHHRLLAPIPIEHNEPAKSKAYSLTAPATLPKSGIVRAPMDQSSGHRMQVLESSLAHVAADTTHT
jgi:hypothetical protein